MMEDGCLVELFVSCIYLEKFRDMSIEYDDGVIEVDFINRELINIMWENLVFLFVDESVENVVMKDLFGYGIGFFVEVVCNGDELYVMG